MLNWVICAVQVIIQRAAVTSMDWLKGVKDMAGRIEERSRHCLLVVRVRARAHTTVGFVPGGSSELNFLQPAVDTSNRLARFALSASKSA